MYKMRYSVETWIRAKNPFKIEYYCQAQPKLQVKLSLKAEISLIFAISSIRPAARPAAWNSSEKAGIEQNLTKETCRNVVGPNLEDYLHFWQIEDDLNFFSSNGRRPHFFCK